MEKLRPRGGVCSDLRWGRLGRQRRPAGGADEPVGAEAQVPGEDGPQRLGSTWTSGELPDPGGFSTLTWKGILTGNDLVPRFGLPEGENSVRRQFVPRRRARSSLVKASALPRRGLAESREVSKPSLLTWCRGSNCLVMVSPSSSPAPHSPSCRASCSLLAPEGV